MTRRWWWVRHGPTHATGLVGHLDLPADLSDSTTLNLLADFLPKTAPIISSDLQRASATADKIGGNRLRLPSSRALREMDYGQWDGKTFAQIAASDPAKSQEFWQNPGDIAPPDGESWNQLTNRIHGEIERISHVTPASDVIVVAHFGVILAALQIASKMKPKSVFSFKVNNLSVSCFTHLPENDAWRVELVNQTIRF